MKTDSSMNEIRSAASTPLSCIKLDDEEHKKTNGKNIIKKKLELPQN